MPRRAMPSTMLPNATGLVTHRDGDWTYNTTVVARADQLLPTRPNGEGLVRWVPIDDVSALSLHPLFKASWPELRCVMP
jgi:hypothetical protein